jgi:hypothetical protein
MPEDRYSNTERDAGWLHELLEDTGFNHAVTEAFEDDDIYPCEWCDDQLATNFCDHDKALCDDCATECADCYPNEETP